MVTPFESVLLHLKSIGFFELLPFMLAAAVFYGLLRRSKIFGEPKKNTAVNATVAIVAAFMIWAYPFLTGVSLQEYEMTISTFFFNSLIATTIILVGLLIISMFFPQGLAEEFSKRFKKNGFWYAVIVFGLIIAFVIFLMSFFRGFLTPGISLNVSSDLIYSIITIVILIAIVGLVVWFTGKEEKKKSSSESKSI